MVVKFRLAGLACLAAAGLVASPAMGQDALLGSWITVTETPMGNFTATMIVSRADGGYKVEMVEEAPQGAGGGEAMPAMQSTFSKIEVEGQNLRFQRSLDTPQGAMELNYSFTAQGDTLTGEADTGFGAIAITGKRQ